MLLTAHSGAPLIDDLLYRVTNGAAALFLGSGASSGAKSNANTPLLNTTELTNALLRASGQSPTPGTTLPQAYDLAVGTCGQSSVVSLLITHYSHCTPTWHTLIPTLLWKRIYTTNIDDVVDNAYAIAGQRLQAATSLTHVSPDLDDPTEVDAVHLVHLHGWVRRPTDGFVFGTAEYVKTQLKHLTWHVRLADHLAQQTFVFVGTSLHEPDIEYYLRSRGTKPSPARPTSYLVAPDLTSVTVALMHQRDVHCISMDAESFFRWLDTAVRERKKRSALILGSHDSPLSALEVPKASLIAVLESTTQVHSAMRPSANDEPHDFFSGDEPSWSDILSDHDAVFSIVGEYLLYLDGVAAGRQTPADVTCLVGAPGCGKSTALMRIGLEASRRGFYVLEYSSDSGIAVDDFLTVLKAMPGNVLFIVDDGVKHVNELMELVRALRGAAQRVEILTAERTNRRPRIEVARGGLNVKWMQLDWLSDRDIHCLIEKLTAKAALGTLRSKSEAERVRFFSDRADRQLLVAMKELSRGRRFLTILEDEYKAVRSREAREIYAAVSLCHSEHASINSATLARCMNLNTSDLHSMMTAGGELHGVVLRKGDGLVTRHPLIAEHITRYLGPTDGVTLLRSLLEGIQPYLNIKALRKRTPESLLLRRFLDWEFVWSIADRDESLVAQFYESLQRAYDWNSKYWAQWALFERHQGNYRSAYDHALAAVNHDKHFVNRHALGTVLLSWATDVRTPRTDARGRFEEGWSILMGVGTETEWSDRHTITEMLWGIIRYAERWNSHVNMDDLNRRFGVVWSFASELGGFENVWSEWAKLKLGLA